MKTRRLLAERLERRDLMTISLVGTDLQIAGTAGADYAEVEHLPSPVAYRPWGKYRVELNGAIEEFGEMTVGKIIFRGLAGSDEFHNNTDLPCEVYGGSGRDQLFGGYGDDLLVGGSGVDHLEGGYGNDVLYADEMKAVSTSSGASALVPDYELVFEQVEYDFYTTRAHDAVRVHDYLYGGLGDDTLYGGPWNDRLWGDGGNDVIYGKDGDDRAYGGDGNDRIYGGAGNDLLAGQLGADTLVGDGGDDRLFGGDGNDRLEGGSGGDVLLGENGADDLFGGAGNDHLLGGAGSDDLHGNEGNDGLFGGADAAADEFWGDEPTETRGADRFLTRTGDVIHDRRSLDVEIEMCDGSSPWTDRAVYWVDTGFGQLQEFSGNTLILGDTLSEEPLRFYEETQAVLTGSDGTQYCGMNTRAIDGDGLRHEIRVLRRDEDLWLDVRQTMTQSTTIHELAHNWDLEDESAAHPTAFDYWSDFEDLHNGSVFSDGSSDFARPYGQTNAQEDWATCWEVALGYRFFSFPEDPSPRFEAKLALVDQFFSEFRSWEPGLEFGLPMLASVSGTAGIDGSDDSSTCLLPTSMILLPL